MVGKFMLNHVCEFLKDRGEDELALKVLEVFAKSAFTEQQLNEIAYCYNVLNLPQKAIPIIEEIIKTTKNKDIAFPCKYNLAKLYNAQNFPEKAIEIFKQLEPVWSNDLELKLELAYTYFLNNEKTKAEKLLRELESLEYLSEDISTKVNFNLAVFDLYQGKFQSGLKRFIYNLRDFRKKAPSLDVDSYWDGSSDIAEDLIVVSEGGIGDELINIRFLNDIDKLGIKCHWYTTSADLYNTFKHLSFPVISHKDIPTNYKWVYSMELPILLNKQPEDLWHGPYIPQSNKNHPEVINSSKLKIGIRWQGNHLYEQDLHRTVELKDLISGLDGVECDLYSLQRDKGVDQLAGFSNIKDMSSYMVSFKDTLDIISSLDLIITSCTSIAHAAAAMGKQVIVLVPISEYYVWCNPTEKSPWYGDNVHILRQESPRLWDIPCSKIKNIIESLI
jgi:tetratricopeptide (TPR) repeat protein